jgi:hypothetical protein
VLVHERHLVPMGLHPRPHLRIALHPRGCGLLVARWNRGRRTRGAARERAYSKKYERTHQDARRERPPVRPPSCPFWAQSLACMTHKVMMPVEARSGQGPSDCLRWSDRHTVGGNGLPPSPPPGSVALYRRCCVPRDDAAHRRHEGLRVCRAAWLVGVTVREYREMEAGDRVPEFDTWDRLCELYGWPRSFGS